MTSPPDASGPLPPPLVTVTFTVTLIFFFILGMLFICFCRCCSQHLRDGQTANPAGGATRNGLDPMVIHAFPTFVYSNVKHLRRETYELECAICLLEFEGDSILRLLTACYHVFHQECIDLWLVSHKSCPVCRGNLDLSPEKIREKLPAALRENSMPDIQEHGETFFEDAVSINLEDDEEERGRSRSSERRTASSAGPKPIDKLPRWNSTGHSIVKDKPDCKYTLRLPDNMKVRVSKGHTGSCITFGGFTARSHMAFDELPGCSEGKGSID